MAITWKISHPERLVTARGEGTVSLQDIERYLDNVVVSDALPYAKIFDMGTAAWGLSDTDMLVLGARIGPIRHWRQSVRSPSLRPRTCSTHTPRCSPPWPTSSGRCRIFQGVTAARKWLADLARDGSGQASRA